MSLFKNWFKKKPNELVKIDAGEMLVTIIMRDGHKMEKVFYGDDYVTTSRWFYDFHSEPFPSHTTAKQRFDCWIKHTLKEKFFHDTEDYKTLRPTADIKLIKSINKPNIIEVEWDKKKR